jgi:hypothetical protein
LITATIDDIQPLARVSVIEAEPVLVYGRGRGFCAAVARAAAAAPGTAAETRESVTNAGGQICSFFAAMTPIFPTMMLLHFHSKCIADVLLHYIRSMLDAVCLAPCSTAYRAY